MLYYVLFKMLLNTFASTKLKLKLALKAPTTPIVTALILLRLIPVPTVRLRQTPAQVAKKKMRVITHIHTRERGKEEEQAKVRGIRNEKRVMKKRKKK